MADKKGLSNVDPIAKQGSQQSRTPAASEQQSRNPAASDQQSTIAAATPGTSSSTTPGASSPTQAAAQEGSPISHERSALATSLTPVAITALHPGIETKNWCITGRVVCKSDRETSTTTGIESFSFEMRDSAGGEIRVVCFKGQVRKFFPEVEEGKTYRLSRGLLRHARESACTSHLNSSCEIVLEFYSVMDKVKEEEEEEEELVERVAKLESKVKRCVKKVEELQHVVDVMRAVKDLKVVKV